MPEQLPEWNAVGVEPPQSLKDSGWQPGMKPSAQHMNWLLNRAYKCIEELQQDGGNVDDLTQAVADLERKVDTKFAEVDRDIAAVDTKVDTHTKEDLGHVRFIGNTNATNAWVCTSDEIIWDTAFTPPRPKEGSAYRVTTTHNNTGNITIVLKNKDGSKVSNAFSILNSDGSQILPSSFPMSAILTLAFHGNSFFLQGNGSGVKPEPGTKEFVTPGTYSWVVPRGVFNVLVILNGAGGGGGGFFTFSGGGGNAGGGGGSGGIFVDMIPVTPGETIQIQVGLGGTAGANGLAPNTVASMGSPGGFSGFKTSYAHGGDGGFAGTQYGNGGGANGGIGGGYGGNGQRGQDGVGSSSGLGGKNPNGIGDGGSTSQPGKNGKAVIRW
ncbi:hypothetical protein [Lysinibacillus sp. NPDC093692]|uniref:glycine-rich domain-containing protein n=1 Tax=Lysinibacillus sp. NPDC093692 TaxID=3390578 RepID=UPI003D017F17